ncbi:hypothetical protein JNW91_15500 [Micromonospora sp. STR1_7]|uniref:Uncharacterized protein n=1 Tax=Micromonospora parastrephiae TaxID=2806101 RepID=A0ABS1XV47_9ACTN|nr:hypothetical protein [Micromonospora parastrephiae]MBM0233144.1 hypothetical protein [Micromonospora parastrephiae]
MRRLTTTIALLGLSLFALLTPTAASAAGPVEVTSATLVARGVAVDVTLTVTCPVSANGGAEVSLRQRSGNIVAHGSGWAPLNCTGEPQAVTTRVLADAGGAVFHKGVALANGLIELCSEDACDGGPFNNTVRITR